MAIDYRDHHKTAYRHVASLKDVRPSSVSALRDTWTREELESALSARAYLDQSVSVLEASLGLVEFPMDRRSLLGLIPAAAAFGSCVSPPAAQAAPPLAPFPKILGGGEPCTHVVISEMLNDVRSHVVANPGTVVLSADNPELRTIGFSVFSGNRDASEEERDGFLVRISLSDFARTKESLDPITLKKICTQSGRMQIAAALMGPAPKEEETV